MNIIVEERIARTVGAPQIICGNSGYTAEFDFDAEWSEYTEKTAHFRFIRDGMPDTVSVDFTGTACEIPVLREIDFVEIGVSAGSIRTTTPARVDCIPCITDIPAVPYHAKRDPYNALTALLWEKLHGLPEGFVFVVTAEGDFVTTADGAYVIVKE